MGEVKPITVQAIFVTGLPQDLLGGKSLNQENIRIILDKNSDVCGVYPLDEDDEQHYQESFGFISEPGRPTDLFYLQTEQMDWTKFDHQLGYNLWHCRLAHAPKQNIKDTIEHSIGLEGLVGKRFDQDEKCPSCMLGKSTLENYPELREPANHPLSRVHMDLFSSSVTSIEGYNHSVVFTDSHGEYRWHNSLKTKD